MRLFFTILITKLACIAGRAVGRGSSLPGKLALKLYPKVLSRLTLPGIVIAVTGSNGKTSTAEMLAFVLENQGLTVAYNREGSNQTDGIATLLLGCSTNSGVVACDALVLECDERYASKIFAQVKPTALLVTNLCRDQLTRNGHHEFIQACIREAIFTAPASMTLVLNADDPYVASLPAGMDTGSILRFGVGAGAVPYISGSGVYDDGSFCPICKSRMEYNYRVAAHFGSFKCTSCDFRRQKPDIEIIDFDYETGYTTLNNGIRTRPPNASLNDAYNLVSVIAAATTAGVDAGDAAQLLDSYELKGGRFTRLNIGKKRLALLICKHENSLAYNRCLAWIVGQRKPCSVIIMVNSISRKYYTSETSWLWDIDFDMLSDDFIKEIILFGRYAGELMMRFAMTDVPQSKYRQIEGASPLRGAVENCSTSDIFALTCFADKGRLLKELEIGK